MLSTISAFGAPSFTPRAGLLAHQHCHKDPQHHDCYSPVNFHPPEIYSRQMTSHFALSTPQMGDNDLDSFPSARMTFGDEPAGQQTQWSENLSDVPKDCYWCRNGGGTVTGKCSRDSPQFGSGKDSMGNDCPACGGSGVCPHCNGDGFMGN